VKHESEWANPAKWQALVSAIEERTGSKREHEEEKKRIAKLVWWDEVAAGVPGFPGSDVYHINPIGLVGNFMGAIRGSLTLEEARIRAFLRMIRVGEGTQTPAGYERLFGGQSFIRDYGRDFNDHPRIVVTQKNKKTGKSYSSSAAGAYQIMGYNWDDPTYVAYRKQYGIKDYSPISQDRYCAILLRYKRHALNDIKNGDMQKAVFSDHCNLEWASLPGDQYGQGGVGMDTVNAKFSEYLNDELAGKSDLAVPIGGLDDLIK
jgi:muramidase (phage lysozyme)